MATQVGLQCPDCKAVCHVWMTLLVSDGRLVHLAACGKCADGATIRCYKEISASAFADAVRRGMPVIEFGRKK